MRRVDLLQRIQEIFADAGLRLGEWTRGRVDECFACAVPALEVVFYIRVLNAPGGVLLGADAHEDLGLVINHVD